MLAVAFTISLVSLAGIPLTGGFIGKLWIFGDAIRADFLYLALVGVLASLVSVYYYLRPVVAMWFREEETPITRVEASWGLNFALFVTTVGTLILGTFPRYLEALSYSSIRSLTG